MRKYIGLFFLLFILGCPLSGHSGKPKYHVIIDTDGAMDDMRSLSMFLAGNDIRVLAITCSQGTLLPDSVYFKVKSLLSVFHHEGIPVGAGQRTGQELPYWSSFVQGVSWGDLSDLNKQDCKPDAIELLNRITKNYPEKITLIALGSLKTYAGWIASNPDAFDKIERIIWYNNPDITKGFNYQASKESYDFIQKSGINLVVVGNTTGRYTVDESYLGFIQNTNSVYARQISRVHKQPEVMSRIREKGLQFWDDVVPLYLTVPVLFESEEKEGIKFESLTHGIPESLVYEFSGKLLESASTTNNRVFNQFPVDTNLYKPEYAKILNSTIEKYGLVEWKAISLTNEIHGHTGIYSIVGAKMGVRAMEYFNVGVNNLKVTTYCGHIPPLSCFNDGVQISTGATIGQGLIRVSDSLSAVPAVLFTFNDQKLKISLKPAISAQIEKEIAYGVKTHGLLTDRYWLYIEDLALGYWSEFSRFEIFDFTLIP